VADGRSGIESDPGQEDDMRKGKEVSRADWPLELQKEFETDDFWLSFQRSQPGQLREGALPTDGAMIDT